MENKICLDTDVLIDFLRNKDYAVNWIKEMETDNILGTTIVNLFELYSGAYYSSNNQNKISAVKELEKRLKILNLSLEIVEEAGKLNSKLSKEGNIIESKDLLIGITSLKNNFSLKTNNKKHFSRIEGLRLV